MANKYLVSKAFIDRTNKNNDKNNVRISKIGQRSGGQRLFAIIDEVYTPNPESSSESSDGVNVITPPVGSYKATQVLTNLEGDFEVVVDGYTWGYDTSSSFPALIDYSSTDEAVLEIGSIVECFVSGDSLLNGSWYCAYSGVGGGDSYLGPFLAEIDVCTGNRVVIGRDRSEATYNIIDTIDIHTKNGEIKSITKDYKELTTPGVDSIIYYNIESRPYTRATLEQVPVGDWPPDPIEGTYFYPLAYAKCDSLGLITSLAQLQYGAIIINDIDESGFEDFRGKYLSNTSVRISAGQVIFGDKTTFLGSLDVSLQSEDQYVYLQTEYQINDASVNAVVYQDPVLSVKQQTLDITEKTVSGSFTNYKTNILIGIYYSSGIWDQAHVGGLNMSDDTYLVKYKHNGQPKPLKYSVTGFANNYVEDECLRIEHAETGNPDDQMQLYLRTISNLAQATNISLNDEIVLNRSIGLKKVCNRMSLLNFVKELFTLFNGYNNSQLQYFKHDKGTGGTGTGTFGWSDVAYCESSSTESIGNTSSTSSSTSETSISEDSSSSQGYSDVSSESSPQSDSTSSESTNSTSSESSEPCLYTSTSSDSSEGA